MKGIVLISHGRMAEGLADTCRFVMGDSLGQLAYCGLETGESPEHYGSRLEEKIREVDTGDGVIIFCDLYGGTPCKEAILRLNEQTDLIAGMNFPILLEALTQRIGGNPDIPEMINSASGSIVDVKKMMAQVSFSDEDE